MAVISLSYQGRHVPVPESPLTAVSYMLFYEAGADAATAEDRLRFERLTIEFESRTIGAGCTNLGLDELLEGDPKREAEFLAILQLVRTRLSSFGEELPKEYVNRVMAVHEPSWKDEPWPSPRLHKILELIEVIIRGSRLPPGDWLSKFHRGTFPKSLRTRPIGLIQTPPGSSGW
jgi:hypothetical protein